jgi:hypothetical protein
LVAQEVLWHSHLAVAAKAFPLPLKGATQAEHPNTPNQQQASISNPNASLSPFFSIRLH